jgi:5-methylcytosine-specific restriction endonuclease McrA
MTCSVDQCGSYCGAPCQHIDHIEPFDAGGALEVGNVTAACATCNVKKSATPMLLFMAGNWR